MLVGVVAALYANANLPSASANAALTCSLGTTVKNRLRSFHDHVYHFWMRIRPNADPSPTRVADGCGDGLAGSVGQDFARAP
jgi:murein endopeptidase